MAGLLDDHLVLQSSVKTLSKGARLIADLGKQISLKHTLKFYDRRGHLMTFLKIAKMNSILSKYGGKRFRGMASFHLMPAYVIN